MSKSNPVVKEISGYTFFLKNEVIICGQKISYLFKSVPVFLRGLLISKHMQNTDDLRLDLGPGPVKRKGFIGIDLTKSADLVWDLRWGIPFKNSSVEEIRSDHFFEHLNIDDLMTVLGECFRVLKRGRTLDFTVPHFNPYLKLYQKKDIKLLKKLIPDIPQNRKTLYDNSFDIIVWLMYRDGDHKTFFDKESIISKLKKVGFKNILLRKYDKRKDIDKRYSSVYVVAKKE